MKKPKESDWRHFRDNVVSLHREMLGVQRIRRVSRFNISEKKHPKAIRCARLPFKPTPG